MCLGEAGLQKDVQGEVQAFVEGRHDRLQWCVRVGVGLDGHFPAPRSPFTLTSTTPPHAAAEASLHVGPCCFDGSVLDAAAQVSAQVDRDFFPKFLLSDLFFRFMADPAAQAEAEAELAAEDGIAFTETA